MTNDPQVHGLNETGAELIITSHELLPKFRNILAANRDKVKTIVYMESPLHRTPTLGFRDDVTIVSFWEVISRGKMLIIMIITTTTIITIIITITNR